MANSIKKLIHLDIHKQEAVTVNTTTLTVFFT